MATRNFNYDHPHYRVVHQQVCDQNKVGVTTGIEFAEFRSRLNILVHTVDIIVTSAGTLASEILTLLHNGSVFTLKTFDSANTVGRVATITIARTLASIGEKLALMHSLATTCADLVVYTYQVLPMSDVTVI